ncbi:hypothetical protein RRG08_005941 [Elysia crispata]|uniref:Uncharacterized protein n=1 Tax=Elysia crispata TaxID=231223 RepID=A0AAE1CX60_9GAST|nr:hypothetical protein RRG08_005941 [Elysia crispata]
MNSGLSESGSVPHTARSRWILSSDWQERHGISFIRPLGCLSGFSDVEGGKVHPTSAGVVLQVRYVRDLASIVRNLGALCLWGNISPGLYHHHLTDRHTFVYNHTHRPCRLVIILNHTLGSSVFVTALELKRRNWCAPKSSASDVSLEFSTPGAKLLP